MANHGTLEWQCPVCLSLHVSVGLAGGLEAILRLGESRQILSPSPCGPAPWTLFRPNFPLLQDSPPRSPNSSPIYKEELALPRWAFFQNVRAKWAITLDPIERIVRVERVSVSSLCAWIKQSNESSSLRAGYELSRASWNSPRRLALSCALLAQTNIYIMNCRCDRLC